MSRLLQGIKNETFTENGALSHASTFDKCLDLFYSIGALRVQFLADQKQTLIKLEKLIDEAVKEDLQTTLRILFWARDVRNGAGERDIARYGIKYLISNPKYVEKTVHNLHFLPEFGRFDDLLLFIANDKSANLGLTERVALTAWTTALFANNGLAAKWTPRKGAVNRKIAIASGSHNPKVFRKWISGMTNVVEQKMCSKDWNNITYNTIPSKAMQVYADAFKKHSEEAFTAYKSSLEKGETKINAGAIHPHEIVKKVMECSNDQRTLYNEQWKALPNFVAESNERILPICDVSGSMMGLPIQVCVALGIYIAERNTGMLKDHVITFSTRPALIEVTGKNLYEKVRHLNAANWDGSTDLQKTFDLILSNAVRYSVPESDMPTMLLIMSDMQFNSCTNESETNFETIKDKYRKSGYTMPKIVFWNLRDGGDKPVIKNTKNAALISGFSPSILESLIKNGVPSPYQVMLDKINSERYSQITVEV